VTSNRPASNQGVKFSSNLEKKARELESTKYQEELNKKNNNNPEENFRKLEKEVNTLLEEATSFKIEGSYQDALEKAKEAVNKEKNLRKQRENANMGDLINYDLTFAVSLNHAICLEANGMIQEALAKYNEIIKGKQYQLAGRIRVNMGNIYYNQQKYPAAIRMYKMALDILPATSKEMRFKINKNIGHAYVKMGKFNEAIQSYEHILKGTPDHITAFNLIVCFYATGDKLRMKDCFTSMIKNPSEDEDDLQEEEN
jgi:intraflagellar transport protein 88